MKPLRAMWLLNHSTARKFEIPMLKAIGINEIFLPKIIPDDPSFRSGCIDYSEDVNLTIEPNDLKRLNSIDWYGLPTKENWDLANKYFDVVFFIAWKSEALSHIFNNFDGAIIWRQYGLDKTLSYTFLLELGKKISPFSLEVLTRRFWSGVAFEHLPEIESDQLKKSACFLPVGLPPANINVDTWNGSDKKILFICPEITFSLYYNAIYNDFKKNYGDLPHIIGGRQTLPVEGDNNVLGFIPSATYLDMMRESRLMFYHSTEPYHLHYHPLEAIEYGMPLIFMAGGLFDRVGGIGLPGRCSSVKEARKKIQRILNDDWSFINEVRDSQKILINPFKMENCVEHWRRGFKRILSYLESAKLDNLKIQNYNSLKKKRIGILIPIEYHGGTLRGAKLLAEAIYNSSRQENQEADIVLGHLDNPNLYKKEDFSDLNPDIQVRPYKWLIVNKSDAQNVLHNANFQTELQENFYQIPDDSINNFSDCDLLIIVSDRLNFPLLPNVKYITLIYDYLQRYENFMSCEDNIRYIKAAHNAQKVIVTTEFTRQDALQFAGLSDSKVSKLPILFPNFAEKILSYDSLSNEDYFLWTTNLGIHKNHENAFLALQIYYGELNGKLKCYISGVNTDKLIVSKERHLASAQDILRLNKNLQNNISILGNLSDHQFRNHLSHAKFLWHAGKIDNGTFSVIEAAYLSVPSLSSNYPAMREINEQFRLGITWMDSSSPKNMANQLKCMEEEYLAKKSLLPDMTKLQQQLSDQVSKSYWQVIEEFL